MNRHVPVILTIALGLAGLALLATGCTSAPEPQPQETTQNAVITFSTEPDPPKSGENTFEATVTAADGTPVTDADVSVVFYMPAMPAMNMSEMRNSTSLTHRGQGRYRGTGNVIMTGKWDVTVTATRGGDEIGKRTLMVTAR